MEDNYMPNEDKSTNDDFSPNQRSADEMIKDDFTPKERKRWAERILQSGSPDSTNEGSPISPNSYSSESPNSDSPKSPKRDLKSMSDPPQDLNRNVLVNLTGEQRKNWVEIILGPQDDDEEEKEEVLQRKSSEKVIEMETSPPEKRFSQEVSELISPDITKVKETSPPEKEVSQEVSELISPDMTKVKETSPPEQKILPPVRRAKSDTEFILKPKAHPIKRYRSGTKPLEVKHKISTPYGYVSSEIPIGTKNKVEKYLTKLEQNQLVIGDFICNGSYGLVVEATYMNEKKVAVKIIDKEEAADIDPIESDIRIFSQLKHKSIINLIHSMNESDIIFLVMPLADSDLYTDIYNNGAVCEYRAKDWFRQIATGLEYMHSNRLAHRDIKLDNILVMGNTLKICDFDLTVKVNETGKPINRHIEYMHGTLNYMAPELLSKQTPRDLRLADVWSLGITLFAMITYTYAFGYIKGNIRTTVSNMRANHYKYPDQCIPSEQCQNIQAQLLEFDYLSRMSMKQILAHQWFKTELRDSGARYTPAKCSHSLNADSDTGYGNNGQSDSNERYTTNRDTMVVND